MIGAWRDNLREVLDVAKAYGSELADCEAPVREQYRATVAAVDAVRHLSDRIPEGDGCATDCADAIQETAYWLVNDLGDELLRALEPVEDALAVGRELADYLVELLDAFERAEGDAGLGEIDKHVRRLARDLLQAMPPHTTTPTRST